MKCYLPTASVKAELRTGELKKMLRAALGAVSTLRHPVMPFYKRRPVAICEWGCQHRKRTRRKIEERKALQPETEQRSSLPHGMGENSFLNYLAAW